jgi:5-carboxymethyl-2-hydroxymuconate isomerase
MKLLSYRLGGRACWGALSGDGVRNLGERLGTRYPSVDALLQEDALQQARDELVRGPADAALSGIEFLCPLSRPGKIVCIGINYRDRNAEYKDGSQPQKYPSVFMRTSDSLAAHRQAIVRPRESKQLDYEGEIALVIGKAGRRIPEAQALEHVAGITCMNEGTIRDWLYHGKHNVTQGKNFDRTGSIGPWLVTRDEIGSLDGLRVTTRVNGELRQDDTTDNLLFGFRYLIGYLSTFMTLHPGDIIATGTPTGAGARFDPPRWLEPGDVLEVEIPGVGILANPVADE